jgi:hypothetical protein
VQSRKSGRALSQGILHGQTYRTPRFLIQSVREREIKRGRERKREVERDKERGREIETEIEREREIERREGGR